MNTIIAIMAKQPVPHQVKTRLCPPLSPFEAAELYQRFVQDTAEEVARLDSREGGPCSVALAYSPEGAAEAFEKLLPVPLPLFAQQGRDLGERLAGVFDRLFAEGHEQVHIIGSDNPDLPNERLLQSVRLLGDPHTDLVLGPCPDGGYYLVGLKRPLPELFERIPWSTDHVLAATLRRAQDLGLSAGLIEQWDDIDTHADLARFLTRNRHRDGNSDAPGRRTLRYLMERKAVFGL
jgi:hypothetical protein